MKEYIEREAALKSLCTDCKYVPIPYRFTGCQEYENIFAIPVADVVPVVRCKDCRYAYDSVGGWCCSHGIFVDCEVREDFFCADGKLNDDEYVYNSSRRRNN